MLADKKSKNTKRSHLSLVSPRGTGTSGEYNEPIYAFEDDPRKDKHAVSPRFAEYGFFDPADQPTYIVQNQASA